MGDASWEFRTKMFCPLSLVKNLRWVAGLGEQKKKAPLFFSGGTWGPFPMKLAEKHMGNRNRAISPILI